MAKSGPRRGRQNRNLNNAGIKKKKHKLFIGMCYCGISLGIMVQDVAKHDFADTRA